MRQIYHRTKSCLWFGGHGIGDELMLTTVLHEQRRRGGHGLTVMTVKPELFAHSPDVDEVHPLNRDAATHFPSIGIEGHPLNYLVGQHPPDVDEPPPRHLLAEMCLRAGMKGEIELRPYLYLTPAERARAHRDRPYLVIQSSRRSASFALANKEWFPERFGAVSTALATDFEVVQIGLPSDPLLPGVTDLRGKTTLRESAALLAGAQGFIGLVGFLMHLARSVDCPAVIVYGGREHPEQSGYIANENIYRAVPCAPCWRQNSCDHERRCMTEISPAEVLSAWGRLCSRPRLPSLLVARITVP